MYVLHILLLNSYERGTITTIHVSPYSVLTVNGMLCAILLRNIELCHVVSNANIKLNHLVIPLSDDVSLRHLHSYC